MDTDPDSQNWCRSERIRIHDTEIYHVVVPPAFKTKLFNKKGNVHPRQKVRFPDFSVRDPDPIEKFPNPKQIRIQIPVLRIRIHRIHVFLSLQDPDPDPLVRGMDPDPSIIMQK